MIEDSLGLAGIHHVRVGNFGIHAASMMDDETIPGDWNQPYEMTVVAASVSTNICQPENPQPTNVMQPTNVTHMPDPTHECIQYTPSTVEGSHAGNWADLEFDKATISITDPGGGLVHVRLQAGIATESNVRLEGADDNGIHYGVSVLAGDDRADRSYSFRAQGMKTYDIEINRLITPDEGDDLNYSVEWTYEPNYDCYESNDTLATARQIPLNTEITAFAHPGIIEGDGLFVGPGSADYYKFVLAEPTTVALSVIKPSSSALYADFWNSDGDVSYLVAIDPLANGGVETLSDELELPAGTHHVKVFLGTEDSVAVDDDGVPEHWNQPYRLQIKTR